MDVDTELMEFVFVTESLPVEEVLLLLPQPVKATVKAMEVLAITRMDDNFFIRTL